MYGDVEWMSEFLIKNNTNNPSSFIRVLICWNKEVEVRRSAWRACDLIGELLGLARKVVQFAGGGDGRAIPRDLNK